MERRRLAEQAEEWKAEGAEEQKEAPQEAKPSADDYIDEDAEAEIGMFAACPNCRDAGLQGILCAQCRENTGFIYNLPVDSDYKIPSYYGSESEEESEDTKSTPVNMPAAAAMPERYAELARQEGEAKDDEVHIGGGIYQLPPSTCLSIRVR